MIMPNAKSSEFMLTMKKGHAFCYLHDIFLSVRLFLARTIKHLVGVHLTYSNATAIAHVYAYYYQSEYMIRRGVCQTHYTGVQ